MDVQMQHVLQDCRNSRALSLQTPRQTNKIGIADRSKVSPGVRRDNGLIAYQFLCR